MSEKPFYFIINYRAYPQNTKVETFTRDLLTKNKKDLETAALRLKPQPITDNNYKVETIQAGKSLEIELPKGSRRISELAFKVIDAENRPETLRYTVLSAEFDGNSTIWCPIGDYFCSADSVHPFETQTRFTRKPNQMVTKWSMPYKSNAKLRLTNYGSKPQMVSYRVKTEANTWTDRTMYFHCRWRPDEIIPGTPFIDWNFVDIKGKGVYVGDAWTILNIRPNSWWGEGDEKIYVDDAWNKGFPTHFGTGTEDYYGWAGGVYPDLKDEFSAPWLSNVKVGGLDGHTQGFNIVTRTRGLDAIPFNSRFRFDMEASFGTDMREKWDLLGYSAVVFYYALPGATDNRPDSPRLAAKPIMSMDQIKREAERIKAGG